MLQNLGDVLKRQRLLAIVILVPLAVIFALWGAYGVVNMSFGAPDYGLKINGESIPVATINRQWEQEQARMAQAMGGVAIPDAQRAMMQQRLLDQTVDQTLLLQQAQSRGYRVSDVAVADAYKAEPSFQVDGKFDQRAAQSMLLQANMTPEAFESETRRNLTMRQLVQAIGNSDFVTPQERDRLIALENEQRQVSYVVLAADHFPAAAVVDEAKVKAWYDVHPKDFLAPESAHLQFARMRLADVEAQVKVTPQELQDYYAKQQARFAQNEKRRAHHILISIAEPKDAAADAAALAKARAVLAEIKAGKDFAQEAKANSADSGSAANGGDLGWAERAAYVAPFADALFKMKPGELSEPVKTQYGYHIIRLDEIQGAGQKPFDEVKAQVETDFRHDKAAELFGDRQEQLQRKVEGGTVTDLAALAKEMDMTTGDAAQFTRNEGGGGLAPKPDLLAQVFGDQAVAVGRIGGPVALADDDIVVFRVVDRKAAAALPVSAVHDRIVALLKQQQVAAAEHTAADAAVAKLGTGASIDVVAADLGGKPVSAGFIQRSEQKVPLTVRQAAFALPFVAGKNQFKTVTLEDGGMAVMAVTAAKPGVAGDAESASRQAREYAQREGNADVAAYVSDLRRRATIKKNPSLFN